ncbi:YdeI/OmpD-associated family protein [Winogradskyella sp.]|uniref:YdeI/OmpD-associated family protein n=1 Tax=Winogradskyella sp. TaxID=1883156 RepID=UPI002609D630|nr:YdeI/OmpD-associated family protein [Winogradskyella sp.]
MTTYQGQQTIKQLEKRKGGYYYLKIEASIVEQFPHKRKTRLICEINNEVSYRCGLNHLGDGNFFIILAGKYLKALDKELGDGVDYILKVDPNQLGVDMPEVLQVLLDQDEEAKSIFNALTNGKKRSLIYSILKIKDIDKQVKKTLDFLSHETRKNS